MPRYQITNYFDVWGHGPSECLQYNCTHCVRASDEAEEGSDVHVHDEDRCECGYEINNWCSEGEVEVEDSPADLSAALLAAMIARNLIRESATLDMIDFEWPGPDTVVLSDAKSGCPLFSLTMVDEATS